MLKETENLEKGLYRIPGCVIPTWVRDPVFSVSFGEKFLSTDESNLIFYSMKSLFESEFIWSGDCVRYFRNFFGWSFSEMENELGLEPETIKNWEEQNGSIQVSAEEMNRIKNILFKRVQDKGIGFLKSLNSNMIKSSIRISSCDLGLIFSMKELTKRL